MKKRRPRPNKKASHEGKRELTEDQAKDEARRRSRFARVRPYRCRYGNHWHVGHFPKPRHRRKRY